MNQKYTDIYIPDAENIRSWEELLEISLNDYESLLLSQWGLNRVLRRQLVH